jgi:hypothetical protein
MTSMCHDADGKKVQVLLNVGGPDRVSRLQMAESVAAVRGYDHSIIKSVSASSVLISSVSETWNVALKHRYLVVNTHEQIVYLPVRCKLGLNN